MPSLPARHGVRTNGKGRLAVVTAAAHPQGGTECGIVAIVTTCPITDRPK
jgi:hypothetical protein